MPRRGFVPQRPERIEIFPQFLQFANAGSRQAFSLGDFSGSIRLLPKHELAGLRRHACSQIQFS